LPGRALSLLVLILGYWPGDRPHAGVREIDDDERRRLVRIVRRGSGSVVTWRYRGLLRPGGQVQPLST
jgi:hypothetical protein